jgi:uncharacterized protein
MPQRKKLSRTIFLELGRVKFLPFAERSFVQLLGKFAMTQIWFICDSQRIRKMVVQFVCFTSIALTYVDLHAQLAHVTQSGGKQKQVVQEYGDNGSSKPNVALPENIDIRQVQTLAERFIFLPAKHPIGEWEPAGLQFTDVEFSSADGKKLHGWLVSPDEPKQIVLFCHGNAGNVTFRANRLEYFFENGYAGLVFDYRGYGKSEGVPTTEGVLADAEAALNFLAKKFDVKHKDIIILGRSLGGSVAVQLAAKHTPKALILESSFTSFHDIADFHVPSLSKLVSKKELNSLETIAGIQAPVLISHGDADNIIPFEHGQRLFEAAGEPKTFVRIVDGGHAHRHAKVYDPQFEKFISGLK